MTNFLKVAAALAVLAAASPLLAKTNPAGHWEWRTRPVPGQRSGPIVRARVGVEDGASVMAYCDCRKTTAGTAGCMTAIPGEHDPA